MKRIKKTVSVGVGITAAILLARTSNAQSADALIDKLVQKGVLTVKEGNELREEADKNFTTSYQIRSGMQDWVTALKINGDLRLRYDGLYADNPAFIDRNRMRYRMRFGATAALKDDFEIGFRLSSGENASGGYTSLDPISGNASFGDNASRKLIGIDLAYAKWTPIQSSKLTLALSGGKMENPFAFSDIVFDADYNPEGLASQLSYNFSDKHVGRLNVGGFVVDENSSSSNDPYLVGAQARLESIWNPKWQSSFGVGALAISGADALNTGSVPDQNRGNRRDADGNLLSEFNPLVADAALIYNLESFPTYIGTFPIRVGGELLHNPGAGSDNNAFAGGIGFGKAGKRGTWELIYRYKYLESDSWYEEMVDSDTGAFYQSAAIGGKSGYGAGTNLRGHWIRGAWSPVDSLVLSATCYLFDLIDESPSGSDSSTMRLQLDAMWKF